jgi:DNA-binding NarL/FixJ family response regulator
MSNAITVGIVEDSAAFRTHLHEFLNATSDVRCVCTYADGQSALEDLPARAPHVVLMDLQLPDCSGVDCTWRLKAALPETQFLIFTVHEDSERIFQALTAGASGYLLKRTPPAGVAAAIREIHAGGAPMSSEIARKVVQHFRAPPPAKAAPEALGLSPRQEAILKLLAQGHVPKEIAEELGITTETVRSYLKVIYQKLHVRTRTEAVIKYLG